MESSNLRQACSDFFLFLGGINLVSCVLNVGKLPVEVRILLDAKGVRDTVDIVEVCDDLDGLGEVLVLEAVAPKGFQVLPAHRPGRTAELDRVVEERLLPLWDRRPPVVRTYRPHEPLVPDLGPEVREVRRDSIAAAVHLGDHDRDHLAGRPGEAPLQ